MRIKSGLMRLVPWYAPMLMAGYSVAQYSSARGHDLQAMESLVTVTVKNVTKHQSMTAPVVVVHKEGLSLYRLGQTASDALANLAERGDAVPLLHELEADPRVRSVAIGAKEIAPGKSVTVTVDARRSDRISVLGKLQQTNDGIFSLEAARTPAPGSARSEFATALDVGSEANTERCADVPACSGSDRHVAAGREGVVTEHPGVLGLGDLAPSTYDFSTVVAEVIIGPDVAGRIRVPLGLSISSPEEYVLQEPSMCEGSASATIEYSRAKNSVVVEVDYRGVPTDLTTTYPYDPSTPYNMWPITVTDGAWQTWLVGYFGGWRTNIWYDAEGRLIGTEYQLPNSTPPPGAFAIETELTGRSICLPMWKPDDQGRANFRWELTYDQLLDSEGTGGLINVFANYTFGDPGTLGRLDYGGVPKENAMSFDEFLYNIRVAGGIAVATTYEPDPKPEYLSSRSNNVAAWLGTYPVLADTTPPTPCETHINDPFPVRAEL